MTLSTIIFMGAVGVKLINSTFHAIKEYEIKKIIVDTLKREYEIDDAKVCNKAEK